MKLGYQASKNRLTTTVSLNEERSFRLRRLAEAASEKISPFIGRLIDQEWERTHGSDEVSESESEQIAARVA